MRYLSFDLGEAGEGITTLEAMASTSAGLHGAVMAEVQQVLDWAWRRFPHSHGPADEGHDWDHDLQVVDEDGGWCSVTLSLTGSPAFVAEFLARFGETPD
ncbi:MAG: hypothetical protein QM722_23925 [Piscinibacter sp.]